MHPKDINRQSGIVKLTGTVVDGMIEADHIAREPGWVVVHRTDTKTAYPSHKVEEIKYD